MWTPGGQRTHIVVLGENWEEQLAGLNALRLNGGKLEQTRKKVQVFT